MGRSFVRGRSASQTPATEATRPPTAGRATTSGVGMAGRPTLSIRFHPATGATRASRMRSSLADLSCPPPRKARDVQYTNGTTTTSTARAAGQSADHCATAPSRAPTAIPAATGRRHAVPEKKEPNAAQERAASTILPSAAAHRATAARKTDRRRDA